MIGLLKPIDPEEEFQQWNLTLNMAHRSLWLGLMMLRSSMKGSQFGCKNESAIERNLYPGADGNDVHVKSLGYMIQMVISWSVIKGLSFMGNGFSTTPVSRITLFCRDLDQSLELYRDILGFKEIEIKPSNQKNSMS